MKLLTWMFLLVISTASIFAFRGAKVDKYSLILVGLVVLVALSSDLKEFNLWGFWGKKKDEEKALAEAIDDGPALPHGQNVKPKKGVVEEAANSQEIHLMDSTTGNFLALAFEIERLLRIYATTMLVKDVSPTINIKRLAEDLSQVDLLTETGKKQVDAIVWLRNLIVHGRQSEINEETVAQGVQVASNLYNELRNVLYPEKS